MSLQSITLSINSFSTTSTHPLGAIHKATRWQVDYSGADFSDPLIDTGWDEVNLLTYTTDAILDDALVYQFRVAVMDSLEIPSEWSGVGLLGALRTLETAWAFTLDGHIFYVMNYMQEAALIYDVTTQQWYRWFTKDATVGEDGLPYWNMFRGTVWKGRVLAADATLPKIWEVDPHSMLDEASIPIQRAVTGFMQVRGSASVRQGSLRVSARKEDVAEPSVLSMRFSDDNGKTWSTPRTVELLGNSYSQRLEFRSLGRVRAPGRLWELSDEGGFVTLYGADADLEGEDEQ